MRDVHLLVVIHGMWGQPSHVATVASIIREIHSEYSASKHPESAVDLDVLLPETNRELHTYDGMDWCAERVFKETMQRKDELERDGDARVTRFSMFGYSLGGLVARYAVGILYAHDFFKTIVPVNFTTFATPHIGIINYGTVFGSFQKFVGSRLLSRTGEQFFAVDKFSPDGQPLLLVMADKDKIFYKALVSFQHINIYANGVNDRTVPFVTAYITSHDPFAGYPDNGATVKFDPKYHPVIVSHTSPETPPIPPVKPFYTRFTFPLPPILDKGPFLNVFVYMALPFVVPALVTLVLARFAIATRASRRRIQQLENETPEETRLARMLREFDDGIGRTVADIVEDPTGPRVDGGDADVFASRTGTPPVGAELEDAKDAPHEVYKGALQPVLTPAQHTMVEHLNALPHLKKHIVFVPHYMNSHAVIVCRDPASFPAHHEGKGVIRHWADRFVF